MADKGNQSGDRNGVEGRLGGPPKDAQGDGGGAGPGQDRGIDPGHGPGPGEGSGDGVRNDPSNGQSNNLGTYGKTVTKTLLMDDNLYQVHVRKCTLTGLTSRNNHVATNLMFESNLTAATDTANTARLAYSVGGKMDSTVEESVTSIQDTLKENEEIKDMKIVSGSLKVSHTGGAQVRAANDWLWDEADTPYGQRETLPEDALSVDSDLSLSTYDMTPLDKIKNKSFPTILLSSSQALFESGRGCGTNGPPPAATVPTTTAGDLLSQVAYILALPMPYFYLENPTDIPTMQNTLHYMCMTSNNVILFNNDFLLYDILSSYERATLPTNFIIILNHLNTIYGSQAGPRASRALQLTMPTVENGGLSDEEMDGKERKRKMKKEKRKAKKQREEMDKKEAEQKTNDEGWEMTDVSRLGVEGEWMEVKVKVEDAETEYKRKQTAKDKMKKGKGGVSDHKGKTNKKSTSPTSDTRSPPRIAGAVALKLAGGGATHQRKSMPGSATQPPLSKAAAAAMRWNTPPPTPMRSYAAVVAGIPSDAHDVGGRSAHSTNDATEGTTGAGYTTTDPTGDNVDGGNRTAGLTRMESEVIKSPQWSPISHPCTPITGQRSGPVMVTTGQETKAVNTKGAKKETSSVKQMVTTETKRAVTRAETPEVQALEDEQRWPTERKNKKSSRSRSAPRAHNRSYASGRDRSRSRDRDSAEKESERQRAWEGRTAERTKLEMQIKNEKLTNAKEVNRARQVEAQKRATIRKVELAAQHDELRRERAVERAAAEWNIQLATSRVNTPRGALDAIQHLDPPKPSTLTEEMAAYEASPEGKAAKEKETVDRFLESLELAEQARKYEKEARKLNDRVADHNGGFSSVFRLIITIALVTKIAESDPMLLAYMRRKNDSDTTLAQVMLELEYSRCLNFPAIMKKIIETYYGQTLLAQSITAQMATAIYGRREQMTLDLWVGWLKDKMVSARSRFIPAELDLALVQLEQWHAIESKWALMLSLVNRCNTASNLEESLSYYNRYNRKLKDTRDAATTAYESIITFGGKRAEQASFLLYYSKRVGKNRPDLLTKFQHVLCMAMDERRAAGLEHCEVVEDVVVPPSASSSSVHAVPVKQGFRVYRQVVMDDIDLGRQVSPPDSLSSHALQEPSALGADPGP